MGADLCLQYQWWKMMTVMQMEFGSFGEIDPKSFA
jgi:hypothetical protein